MPSTKGLEVLLKHSHFSRKDWEHFLEIRRELVEPFLDVVLLGTLGSQKCLHDGKGHYHALRDDAPTTFLNGKVDEVAQVFGIQGIFPVRGYQPEDARVVKSCGLSRKGQWLWIEIDCTITDTGYQQATEVRVAEYSSIEDILSDEIFDPRDIDRGIASTVGEWLRIHEKIYKKLADVNETIGMEYKVLELKGML